MLNSHIRFVLLFAAIFILLEGGYYLSRGSEVEIFLVDTATVIPSVAVINRLTPAEKVHAVKHQLVSPYGKLSVLTGCEGAETMLLLLAAIFAFRAPFEEPLVKV